MPQEFFISLFPINRFNLILTLSPSLPPSFPPSLPFFPER